MPKSTLILALITAALGFGTFYCHRQDDALAQSIAREQEQCAQEMAQLKSAHQAKLGELQQHLLQRQ